MEKPGIEPATPGLQGTFFCFPGYKPVPPGWFKICVGFITRTPKGSPKVVLWRSRESNLRPLVYKGKNFFVAFLDINQFRRVGLRFVLVLYRELLKAQPKLVLWRSRESNQRPLVYKAKTFCGFPGYKPVPPGWFKICTGFILKTPEGSTEIGIND